MVISEFNSVISVAERTDPSRKRSIKFSVGLPQPSYAFVSDMSVRRNTSQSQARQTCTQARQTNHNSLVAIFLLTHHRTYPHVISNDVSPRCEPISFHSTKRNQRAQCKKSTWKRKKEGKKNSFRFKTRPALGLGRVKSWLKEL